VPLTPPQAASAWSRFAIAQPTRRAPAGAGRSVSVPGWRNVASSSTRRNGTSMSHTTHGIPGRQCLDSSSVVVNLTATAELRGWASTRATAAAVLPARLQAPETVTITRPSYFRRTLPFHPSPLAEVLEGHGPEDEHRPRHLPRAQPLAEEEVGEAEGHEHLERAQDGRAARAHEVEAGQERVHRHDGAQHGDGGDGQPGHGV